MPTTLVGSCTQLAYLLSRPMFLLSIIVGLSHICCILLSFDVLSEEEEEKELQPPSLCMSERESERVSH